MSEHMSKFSETLRQKLANVDSSMSALKAKIDAHAEGAEHEARAQLDAVKKRLAQGETKAAAARADLAKWVEHGKATAEKTVAEWKAKGETAKLKSRAELAERYAAATLDVAVDAVDEAAQAALQAWLARRDADHAPSK